MSKIFHKIFPIFDHLYIFQLLEYESPRFFRWFLGNPLERNLQKKGKLNLTSKAFLILSLSLFLMTIKSLFLTFLMFGKIETIVFALIFLLLQFLSPFFLIVSWWLIYPLQKYIEYRLVNKASAKLKNIKDLKIVAIAGSYGKTSTKNILYTLLWKKYYVVKTPKSFNTLVSIASTILSDIKDNTQVLIVEMDSYNKGDLTKLSKLVNPDYGILTSIAPQHLERFGSMENLAEAQVELLQNLRNKVFVNGDDKLIRDKVKKNDKIIYFGASNDSDIKATGITESDRDLKFDLKGKRGKVAIELPLKGRHNIVNFLAATAVALELGMGLDEIKQRALLILPTEHRLEIKNLDGINLIDNSYNTNPTVSQKSLELLASFRGKKILITPGFVELGNAKEKESEKLMLNASKVADQIIIVGNNSRKELTRGLEKAKFEKGKVHYAENTASGLQYAREIAKTGDAILLENDLPDQYS